MKLGKGIIYGVGASILMGAFVVATGGYGTGAVANYAIGKTVAVGLAVGTTAAFVDKVPG